MVLDDDIPLNWEAMPANTTSKAFPLTAGTPEYTEIEKLFSATCTQAIIKVDWHALYLYWCICHISILLCLIIRW